MQPQLPALLDANAAYRRSGLHPGGAAPAPVRRLVLLTCMDVRIDPLAAFGLRLGDAHVLRNAGGRVCDDVVRSIALSVHLLGTREVGIVQHTRCGLEGVTNDEVAARTGLAGVDHLTIADVHESVRTDVEAIRRMTQLPSDAVVWGAVFNVQSGELRVVCDPQSPAR